MGIYYPFLGGGRTCNQITTPLVYDESLSVEQQIACLFGKIANIDSDFVTTVEFDDFKSQIHAEQVAQTEQLEGYTDSEIAKLDKELRDLIAGWLAYLERHGWQVHGQRSRNARFLQRRYGTCNHR